MITTGALQPPLAPTGLKLDAVSANSLTLSWKAPAAMAMGAAVSNHQDDDDDGGGGGDGGGGDGQRQRHAHRTTPPPPPPPPPTTTTTAAVLRYHVVRDDWWTNTSTLAMAVTTPDDVTSLKLGAAHCQLGQASRPDCRLLPSTRYRVAVAAANEAGWGPLSPTVTVATNTVPQCGNPSDLAVFRRTKATMQQTIQGCLISCALQPADKKKSCAASCVHDGVGLSTGCSGCWVTMGECILANCKVCALEPKSSACTSCSGEKCFPATVLCTGIPEQYFPTTTTATTMVAAAAAAAATSRSSDFY